ncbi:MAG: hypothetical protein ACFFB2_20425, partial [Promethearchaeota archaeon]
QLFYPIVLSNLVIRRKFAQSVKEAFSMNSVTYLTISKFINISTIIINGLAYEDHARKDCRRSIKRFLNGRIREDIIENGI